MTGIIISTPPTVELPPGSSGGGPTSLPPVTYQYAVLNFPQTWTAKQTFPLGNIAISAGDISGNLPIAAFNGGVGATSTTFWRGDGTWVSPASSVTSDPKFYAADYGVKGDGGTYTTQMQTLLNTVKAAGGGIIILPAGHFSCDALTYATAGSGILPGIHIEGQGAESTQIIFTGTAAFLFNIDSTPGFQSFITFSNFKITGNGANAGGISLHVTAYVLIEDMHILVTGTGIYDTCAGDTTSTFQAICRRVRFDNCATTAGTFGVDILPSGTAVEISNWRFEGCQWEANGVPGAAVTPPTSGAVRYRGLIAEFVNCGFTTNQNTSIYIAKTGGVQAVTIDSCDFENTISTVLPHIYCDTGLRLFKANNIQFLNADTWKCQGGIWFDSTVGVQGNITIDGVTIRVSTGNNPYVVFKQTGTASNWMGETNRVRNVNWQLFDGTGQTRFSSAWQFDFIEGQCQLIISALGTVKLIQAGYGNTMPLRLIAATGEWVSCPIPNAGISAAGLVGLSANTRYYIYLGNSGSLTSIIVPTLNLSAAAPAIDAVSGYAVSGSNPNLTYVGSVVTDGSGSVATTSQVYSFFPSSLNPGQLPATTTNDNALAGNVGEYIESPIAGASKVALVSGTAKTITSISLTAGDWDVDIMGYILPAATTTTTIALLSISGTTNTMDFAPGKFAALVTASTTFTGGNEIGMAIPPYRLSLSVTTTVFFVASSTFATSTSAVYGLIRARRVR